MRTDRRTDGQTGMTMLTVAFRIFAKAPKTVEQHISPGVDTVSLTHKYPEDHTVKH
jgi:hypothetical protein